MPAARRFASPSFRAMLESKYQTQHILLASGEHGYVEGAQHLRPTRFKTSRYDTSVILLQSQRARRDVEKVGGSKWKGMFEAGIRAAFGSGHENETIERKREGYLSTYRKEQGKEEADTQAEDKERQKSRKKKHRSKK